MAAVVLDGCGGADSFGRSGSRARPTIVVEHGAFTDASGWDAVVGRLRRRGYDVLAPANPLRGVAADAAYLRSVLKTIEGPIVLVGHSYGGAVITNAAVGVPRVKALVYIAAVAPEEGESQMDIFARFPGSLLGPSTIVERKFPGGVDQYVKVESFRDVFSADLPAGEVATAAATQRPLAKVAGSAVVRAAGVADDPDLVHGRHRGSCDPAGGGALHGQACSRPHGRGEVVAHRDAVPPQGRDQAHPRRRAAHGRLTRTSPSAIACAATPGARSAAAE